MTPGRRLDRSWIWHPFFSEEHKDTAGLFVHFRKSISFDDLPPSSFKVHITADTRYKLYVNSSLISFGPVKGDRNLWFYDEVDLGPHLRPGNNSIHVVVLRYFYNTKYARSFPRLPKGGLRIVPAGPTQQPDCLRSDASWETAIDPWTTLRVNEAEDDFLHIYEQVRRNSKDKKTQNPWKWVFAEVYDMATSTGNSVPWNLSPRLIPHMESHPVELLPPRKNKVVSTVPVDAWEAFIAGPGSSSQKPFSSSSSSTSISSLASSSSSLALCSSGLCLPAGSSHTIDLEAPAHTTAFLTLRFRRPRTSGARVTLMYSESYEDRPRMVPYLRSKAHRLDDSKSLYGPSDHYELEGSPLPGSPSHDILCSRDSEVVSPFHWRTFRFIRLCIETGPEDLFFESLDIRSANYPLDPKASILCPGDAVSEQLWSTSVRTLKNCMHDCYEDCPFYEQLQYAMDTRSSALFTYRLSCDDRLARQAIQQIHNSFQPVLGLTCSRAPSHKQQVIPHFSLYWILMLADHFQYFGDASFIKRFLPVADALLAYFESRIDQTLGLVVCDFQEGVWNFVDWAESWQPFGIPPAVEQSGISSYTNLLYAYTLENAATMLSALGRPGVANEYRTRALCSVQAVQKHCFDGDFFTDSLAKSADKARDYSTHSQVWAVLSGAMTGQRARSLLQRSLKANFTPTSISMSFYTLRALSIAGGDVYSSAFHHFWDTWKQQLSLGVTTWEEDSVSQRSDCHAWGSSPIFEFMEEVAGIRLLGPGCSTVLFRPRLSLYPTFSATMPMWIAGSCGGGTLTVSWKRVDGQIRVSLVFNMDRGVRIRLQVELPGEPMRMIDSTSDVSFLVKA